MNEQAMIQERLTLDHAQLQANATILDPTRLYFTEDHNDR